MRDMLQVQRDKYFGQFLEVIQSGVEVLTVNHLSKASGGSTPPPPTMFMGRSSSGQDSRFSFLQPGFDYRSPY